MSESKTPDVSELFQSAQEEGHLSAESMKALTVVDVGAQIQAALGVPALDVQASDVILVTMMPDDSGSIAGAGNVQLVIDGHNLVLDALQKSKQKENVLAHCRYLNGYLFYPYCSLEQAVRMSQSNYDPVGGTPLYDHTVLLLGTVLAKTQEFTENGIAVRTVTLIITDGHDEHSRKVLDPRKISPLVRDMLMEENHIVAAMGIADGYTDFQDIFRQMGIEDRWILTPANTEKEIRGAFQLFSSSAVRASQSAASFSQIALGGFNK